jgi:hypothetical protein
MAVQRLVEPGDRRSGLGERCGERGVRRRAALQQLVEHASPPSAYFRRGAAAPAPDIAAPDPIINQCVARRVTVESLTCRATCRTRRHRRANS